jgi:hypothetical protein
MGLELIDAICEQVVVLENEAKRRTLGDWEAGKLAGLHAALNLVSVTYPNLEWNKPSALLRARITYFERGHIRNG